MIGATRAFTASRLPSSLLLRARRAANMACKAEVHLDFNTNAFEKELVEFAGTKEYIVKGGRDKFTSLPKAFEGVSEVRPQVYFGWKTVRGILRVCKNALREFDIQHHGASRPPTVVAIGPYRDTPRDRALGQWLTSEYACALVWLSGYIGCALGCFHSALTYAQIVVY